MVSRLAMINMHVWRNFLPSAFVGKESKNLTIEVIENMDCWSQLQNWLTIFTN